MLNRRGVGLVGAVLLFFVFLIIWGVFLGKFISETGAGIVASQGMSGVEAFFFENLNIVVFLSCVLGILAFSYFVGGA